jgi:ketosteroid isomerase-like protein
MSQENVELARRAWESWIAGDLEGLLEFFDPAVEWDTTQFEGWPEARIESGKENVRRFLEDWLASWEGLEAGVDEYMDVDDERVLVITWQRAYGPGSQALVQMDWAQLITSRGGLAVRLEAYSDQQAARAAVGLPAAAP